ncbi:autotransporter outer membrane beta-barrel domain-containing protein [Acinetobacter sp. YH16039]|uniref:autotransporter outer membrane beta-barrel domain-containing protein n=1 Tax=Acinetobacter sp. YH16039 TaxID=2601184 RepID=UPI0015D3622C|nr:autotransporter outer membrane beta-barrel domain-containing protein [Acinetobacter sp. YH16039]
MKKISTILGLFLGGTAVAYAAPNDPYLHAKNFNAPASTLQIDLAVDAVNDSIDIFDMRESEGINDSSAGDYQGFHLSGQYELNPQWSIEASYWQREIEYRQDSNKIDSALLAVRYTPALQLKKRDALSFRASVWGNTADTLSKSSPTVVNHQTFNQVQVHNPEDLQLQLDAIFSRKLDPMNQLNAFANVGYSKVKVSNVDLQAKLAGCLMDISVNDSNQYNAQLAQPCSKDGITINELNIQGNANEFGFDIEKDLNYDSYYAGLGGSWNWRYKQFESQIAYQYQRLWRNDIDDRVSNFGNTAIKDNHTLGVKFSYDFTPQITAFLQGEIYQNNFVGNIPFLYNGVTASRLDKRYGLASLGLNIRMF